MDSLLGFLIVRNRNESNVGINTSKLKICIIFYAKGEMMSMTIRELYEWAEFNGVEDYEIIVKDNFGSQTSYVVPEIDNKKKEVEL